jgi:hypothetical protein
MRVSVISSGRPCVPFLLFIENFAQLFAGKYCTHLVLKLNNFLRIDHWGGESKNLVHQPHKTFVYILSRVVYQLITFEVLHLPFLQKSK